MWLKPQFPADLVTFTEEILNGKLLFLCSVGSVPCITMKEGVLCYRFINLEYTFDLRNKNIFIAVFKIKKLLEDKQKLPC